VPSFDPKFFSIVFLGSQNPQILNHDFLVNNKVLPLNKEPFKSLIKEANKDKKPFTRFLSSPVVTSLTYKWISIIIDPNRYMIKDNKSIVASKSPIVLITKKYFGEILRYTPFKLGGMNFTGRINFNDADDEKNFDRKLGTDSEKFKSLIETDTVQYSTKINFPWNNDQIELKVDKHRMTPQIADINFNFEFIYEDIDGFISKLDKADIIYNRFMETLMKLKVEKKQ